MNALHLICGRDDKQRLNNLVVIDKAAQTFRSGQWDIPEDDAGSLIGGWLYLYAAKATRSEFGGVVLGFEPVIDTSLARPRRIVFIVQMRAQGICQRWRGKKHSMAHSGGLVDADLPHELA